MQKIYEGIDKKTAFFAGCLLTVLSLCSCAQSGTSITNKEIPVSVSDSSMFVESGVSGFVKRGQDFVAELHMMSEYVPVSCSYTDYEIEKKDLNVYQLTLKNIKKPLRVSVKSERFIFDAIDTKHCSIKYDMNDGSGYTFTEDYSLEYHIRPNTRNGENLERNGYVLLGWNTDENGQGEHIGLGSRVTVEDGETKTLFAEWVKEIDQDDFKYKTLDDGTINLTGYVGPNTNSLFVIPSKVEGKPVTQIDSSFTMNIPCGVIKSKSVVIPSSVRTLKPRCFMNSNFEEIYFFDNIERINNDCFPKFVKTVHINAIVPPRLQKENYNVRFADNLDLIIKNQDKKKLIFFSGCSMCYGLSSSLIKMNYPDYVVVDAGLNGEFNALFQLECMLPYLGEGDVLIHAPEQTNYYQYLENMWIDSRAFDMVEGNYDLLSHADFSYSSLLFESYLDFNEFRSTMPISSYSEYTGRFNQFGDYLEERPYDEETETQRDGIAYSNNWGFDLTLIDEAKLSTLLSTYDRISETGTKVYYSWAPMSSASDRTFTIKEDAVEFQSKLKAILQPRGYEIISEVTDYIFRGRYFYDTDYHLNDLGIILRTEQLLKDMSKLNLQRPQKGIE